MSEYRKLQSATSSKGLSIATNSQLEHEEEVKLQLQVAYWPSGLAESTPRHFVARPQALMITTQNMIIQRAIPQNTRPLVPRGV